MKYITNNDWPHFVIRAPGATGKGAEVLMDGVPLKMVQRVTADIAYDSVNTVTVTFFAVIDEINVVAAPPAEEER